MRDLVIQCTSGSGNAIAGSFVTAVQAKNAGLDVLLVFAQEAVASWTEKKFEFSEGLKPYTGKIYKNIEKLGFPSDPMEYVRMAKDAGVPVFLCELWVTLLEVKEKLPDELRDTMEMPTVIKELLEAKKVITF